MQPDGSGSPLPVPVRSQLDDDLSFHLPAVIRLAKPQIDRASGERRNATGRGKGSTSGPTEERRQGDPIDPTMATLNRLSVYARGRSRSPAVNEANPRPRSAEREPMPFQCGEACKGGGIGKKRHCSLIEPGVG